MGLLSAAAKVARIANKIDVPDTPSVPTQSSIPKSKMNPLVKKRNLVDDIDTDFYSPVLSTIEQMTIGKKGSKGENISAFLQKRAPNVAKSELESFELNLDPQRLYTREELVELAKEKGSTKYLIEEVDSNRVDTFADDQRQFVQDEELDFVTLTLQGEKDYLRGEYDAHFGGTKNLGHTRSSIRRELPIEGKETNDNNEYLLIEEIQSDTAKKRSTNNDEYVTRGVTDVDTERDIDAYLFDTFDDLDFEFQEDYDVDIPRDIVNTIKKFYKDMYTNPELTSLGDVSIQKKLLKNRDALKKILKDKHGINAEGLDTDKISHTAIRDNFSGDDIENPYLSEKLEDGINFLNSEIVDHFTEKFKVTDIKKSPVLSRSDYLKKLILSNIVYAKKNNLNKIVIPNYKEIARQRTSTFDEVVSEDSPYYAKYIEAMKTGDHGKVAQEYFEGVFKKTYKDALDKVLNTLKKESNNTIEIKNRELRYGDLTRKDRYRTSTATEIDISKFEFDPTTEKLRFNKGGIPMQEQMKFFEDGGLKDEGGMVDEVSGNDVPVGSTRKEVRDDIPAMLSEGEFVFPADVVRYIGLENLMRIRQDAKQGLKQMDAMGQMGNGDEAVLPDDMPFGVMDLIIVDGGEEEEPQEKAQGGVIHANQGTFVTPMFDPSNQDVREYKNDKGDSLFIPFLGGNPVYPIPTGYFPAGQAPEKTETEQAIPVSDDSDPPPPPPQSEFQKAGGFGMDTSATDGKALATWIREAERAGTVGNVVAGIAAAINPLIGGAVVLANKKQKQQIISMLDEKIAQAQNTPIAGQVKALRDLKTRLTTDEGKGILSKVVGGIVDTISDALGLGEEEKKKAKVNTVVNASSDSNEPDDATNKKIDIVDKTAGGAQDPDALADALATADEAAIAGSTLKEDGTYDISSWYSPAPSAPAIPTDPEGPVAFDVPKGMDIQPDQPTVAMPEEPTVPSLTEPDTLPIRTSLMQDKARATIAANAPATVTTAVDDLRKSMANIANINYDESRATAMSSLSGFGEDASSQAIKSYLEKAMNNVDAIVQGSDTPTTTPTTTAPVQGGGDDDDGPSFASLGDNAKAAQQASKNVSTTVQYDKDMNVVGSYTTGGTEEEQQTMQDYVTSAAAGAKGGLFTRRKKKKK